ncbi:MAG TPA: M1 family aminopeptidase [Acidobacteriota bacterium]|nr:M1 family aminopeptidase [Acidobacteriota bacterium]HNT18276.1 M1 family aminopeptidase [Acidobacteriota bacterium]
MKKLFFIVLFLVSVPFLASDFKWSHSYQEGSSIELLSLANRAAGNAPIKSAQTQGFSLNRPAFSLKCGTGTIAWEIDEKKLVRGIYFEGAATVSFGVHDPVERDHLARYIGRNGIENQQVDAVYILPLGSCPDLPVMSGAAETSAAFPKLSNLKESLRRDCPGTLYRLLNSANLDSRDVMVIFEYNGDLWAYCRDSLSETEVQLLRLSHPKGQWWYVWDQAVAMHETGAGALVPEITAEEFEPKFHTDVTGYAIDYRTDENGKLLGGEAKIRLSLKKPQRALLFNYFPGYEILGVTVKGKECGFLKEDFSKAWGYYEYGLLVDLGETMQGELEVTFRVAGRLFDLAEGYIFLRDESQWYPNIPDWDGAAYSINITVPKDNEAISIGELAGKSVNPDGTETYRWECREKVRYATFVLGKFLHTEVDAEGLKLDVALPKGVRTNLLTQVQKFSLKELRNNIVFYSKLFGPVPYPTLKVVITPHSYGMGFPTMLVLTEEAFFRTGSTWPDQMLAHEVAHQWWGNLVDSLSYRDVWLTEGMSEFSSMLYMRARYDESRVKIYNENMLLAGQLVKPATMSSPIDSDSGDDDVENMNNYRSVTFQPFACLNFKDVGTEPARDVPFLEGPICLGTRLLHTCTSYPSMGYTYIVYTKGYFTFNMLLTLSAFTKEGSEGFFSGLRSVCSGYRGKKISTASFFRELERGMKIPVGAFLKSWYESNGIPTVEAKTAVAQKDGKYVVTAEAKCDMDLFLPAPVRIEMPDKKTAEYLLLFQNRTARGEWVLPVKPKGVKVDPLRASFCAYGKVRE